MIGKNLIMMASNRIKIIVFSTLIPTSLQAVPSPYVTTWQESGIINKTSAVLIRDTVSAKRIWVMPPSVGEAKVTNFTPTSEVLGCKGFKSALESMNAINIVIATRDEKLSELSNKLLKLYDEKADLIRLLEQNKNNPELENLSKLRDKRLRLEEKRDDTLVELKNETNEEIKKDLLETYRSIKKQLDLLDEDIFSLDISLSIVTAEIKSLTEKIKNRDTEIAEISSRIESAKASLNEARESIVAIVTVYNSLDAGVISMDYQSGWVKTIAELQKNYPDFQFEPIETRNASIMLALAGGDSGVSSAINGVISYSINGLAAKKSSNGVIPLPMVPDALVGDFNITLNLACPMLDKEGFIDSIGKDAELEIISPRYAMTMTYEFPTVFAEDMSATVDQTVVEKTITDYLTIYKPLEKKIDATDYPWLLVALKESKGIEFAESNEKVDGTSSSMNYFEQEVLNDYLAREWQPVITSSFAAIPAQNSYLQQGVIVPRDITPCNFWFQACSASGWQPKFNIQNYIEDSLVEKNQIFGTPLVKETVIKTANRVSYRPGVIAFKY